MRIIGIDPGLTGAVAFIDGEDAGVADMPTGPFFKTGFVKRAVRARSLREILQGLAGDGERVPAVIERVHAGGGQGASSVFSLGMSFGIALAAIDAVPALELVMVEPGTWKKHFGLPRDKSASIAKAVSLWPALEEDFLARKKDHNRAEALLLARWFQETSAWT